MPELFASNVQSQAVTIRVNSMSGDKASISYNTLDGNQPNTNGNYIAILNSRSGNVPWNLLPNDNHIGRIYGDLPGGDLVMVDLDLPEDGYVVVYSLSPIATEPGENNFCAAVFVPSLKPGTEYQSEVMHMEVTDISSYSAAIRYTALNGYMPKSHNNWVGIWDSTDNLMADPPRCALPVEKNANQGTLALNGCSIVQGHTYVVAYFTGGYDATRPLQSSRQQMACIVRFDAETR